MTGSEKQIAWAEDIKTAPIKTCTANAARFEAIDAMISARYIKIRSKYEIVIAQLEKKPGADKASWWIENRSKLPSVDKIYEMVSTMVFNGIPEDDALKRVFGF